MSDIVSHLRAWGLKVETAPGYKTRGRPYAFKPKAIICHHTASGSLSGNFGSERVVTSGRPDLPGPLCQFLLGRDGTVKVVALGYANHAGTGGPKAGIARNLANTYTYGIEAENNGVGEKWGTAQLNAYYRLCAALLSYMGTTDTSKVIGHKEWTSRKIDPAGIDMNGFRKRVKEALKTGPSVVTVKLSNVKPGKNNKDIQKVKARLKKRGFFKPDNTSGYYGAGLKNAVREFQKSQGWKGKDADGIPGPTTLRRLGFNVV